MFSPRRLSLVAGMFAFAVSAQAEPASVQSLPEVFSRLIAKNEGHGGGVVRISGPNGVLYESAEGRMAGPGSPPMTAQTPFEVASITKAVTAATVLRLVEDGKLSLDSTLGELLPGEQSRGFQSGITVRQLLSHTSGLPDYWTDGPKDREGNNAFIRAFNAEPDRSWQPVEILGYAGNLPAKKPGSKFHYSDTNYVLLGRIVEKVTGQPLQRVFRTMIFEPLGMRSTWLTFKEDRRGAAVSHRYEGSEDLYNVPRQSADWAGGGLVSTTRDLEKFLRGVASGALFKKSSTLAVMREATPVGEEDISYGLGLYRVKLDDGLGELWGHDGHGNSFAYYWPQRDTTLTGTLNQTENDWWPLAEAFTTGESAKVALEEEDDKNWEVELSAGWDSLYMDRGANALRPDGGYGNGIAWANVTITWGFTENDFLTLNFWQAYGTSGAAYREYDTQLLYTRTIGNWELSVGYEFDYAYSGANYTSNELTAAVAYGFEIGNVTFRPSATYFFNLGPDANDGMGFAETASSYLILRLDASVPIYRDIVAIEPWTAYGVNFRYNTRDTSDGDVEPFTGPNNLEFGVSLPIKLHKHLTVSAYVAYSHAFTDITGTAPDTFWSGVSAIVTF